MMMMMMMMMMKMIGNACAGGPTILGQATDYKFRNNAILIANVQ